MKQDGIAVSPIEILKIIKNILNEKYELDVRFEIGNYYDELGHGGKYFEILDSEENLFCRLNVYMTNDELRQFNKTQKINSPCEWVIEYLNAILEDYPHLVEIEILIEKLIEMNYEGVMELESYDYENIEEDLIFWEEPEPTRTVPEVIEEITLLLCEVSSRKFTGKYEYEKVKTEEEVYLFNIKLISEDEEISYNFKLELIQNNLSNNMKEEFLEDFVIPYSAYRGLLNIINNDYPNFKNEIIRTVFQEEANIKILN